MNKLIAVFALFAAAAAAAPQDQAPSAPVKKQTKKAAAKKAAAPVPQELTIPKDAVPNANGSYSWTDKNGKKWLFAKTPFGISRIEDMGQVNATAAPDRSRYVHATDNGDTVKFVQQTPFGPSSWEKKKSELTDEERRIVESQNPKPAPTQSQPE